MCEIRAAVVLEFGARRTGDLPGSEDERGTGHGDPEDSEGGKRKVPAVSWEATI